MSDAPIRPTRYDGREVKAGHFVSRAVLEALALPQSKMAIVVLKKLQRELEDAGLDPSNYECASLQAGDGFWFLLIERTPPRQETPCD